MSLLESFVLFMCKCKQIAKVNEKLSILFKTIQELPKIPHSGFMLIF